MNVVVVILLLTFPGTNDMHDYLVDFLEEHYSTFYGVSQIVNTAIGIDLPESRDTANTTSPHTLVFGAHFFMSRLGVKRSTNAVARMNRRNCSIN